MRCDPARALVYEEGWQSWSPAGIYPALGRSPRAPGPERQVMAFRPGRAGPPEGLQGEGLLAVDPGDGPARLWAAADPAREVPSIRLRAERDRLVVSADGRVVETVAEGGLGAVLAGWAESLSPGKVRPVPPGWCSWYCYGQEVTEEAVLRELSAIGRLGLPVGIVQVDDGHQARVGDWLERSARFGPLDRLADRIRATGRQAGLWIAPFLAAADSRLAAGHPEWLVEGAEAGRNWGGELRVLDVTHPEAAEHLGHVFRTLRGQGFDYFKLDFLYAGAVEGGRHSDAAGLDAYRLGLQVIRQAAGDEAILLGSGAPLLPSIGLVDAMRVSPDVGLRWEPPEGDWSRESGWSALLAGRARAWMHGRLWANDPDCLVVRPEMERRDRWAAHVERCGGLVFSSDPLEALDARGLELTRELLRPSSTEPVARDPCEDELPARLQQA